MKTDDIFETIYYVLDIIAGLLLYAIGIAIGLALAALPILGVIYLLKRI